MATARCLPKRRRICRCRSCVLDNAALAAEDTRHVIVERDYDADRIGARLAALYQHYDRLRRGAGR